jgi:hypothetical protein
LERLAASQKQNGKTQDNDRKPIQNCDRRVAEHPRHTWESAELLGDKDGRLVSILLMVVL